MATIHDLSNDNLYEIFKNIPIRIPEAGKGDTWNVLSVCKTWNKIASRVAKGCIDGRAALSWACLYFHIPCVKSLLQDPSIDPSHFKNRPLRFAIESGSTRVIDMLLSDPRINPSAYNGYALIWASSKGYTKGVMRLLEDPRVDPSIQESKAVHEALRNSHTELASILLKDIRVDPNIKKNILLSIEATRGYLEIAKQLLSHPKFEIDVEKAGFCKRMAKRRGHTETADIIRRYIWRIRRAI